jgi:N-acetylneuraminate synthase
MDLLNKGTQLISQQDKEIFENLFVLEAANNHWGSLDRGIKIVRDYGTVVRYNGVRAAIKFQFRDVDEFIHKDFTGNKEIRYISKTEATKLAKEEFSAIVKEIRSVGCIPMATPFDEASVDLCVEFEMPIIKVASSDINAWPLLEKIATTKKPVIISTGGASEKEIDDVVKFFENRSIPLAINHCVSLYPSEDSDLELNQIDYLKHRYPNHVIGFSSHEYHSWEPSMFVSYAKGARTWERHVDIDFEGVPVSPYCSLPENVDTWFKAFKKAQEMSGGSSDFRRVIPKKETEYLDALVRGVYAKRSIPAGYVFSKKSFENDFYLAVPLKKGQLSVREIITGLKLLKDIEADSPLAVDQIDGPYSENPQLRKLIENRGL